MNSDALVYFNGINPNGKYLTPPATLTQVAERLLRAGRRPPVGVLDWTHRDGEDEWRRVPVSERYINPSNLAEAGWSIVFSHDIESGVRDALEDLLKHRRRQATRDHRNYYRELTYDGTSTARFLTTHGSRPGMIADPDYFPYYVLLVGSPSSLPYSFQSDLGIHHAVGRIFFEEIEDYAHYAQSVVKAEKDSRLRSRQIAFFGTEHENDPATAQTSRELVQKLAASVIRPSMPWEVRELRGAQARKERLRELLGGTETPALLFAACHGVGFDEGDDRQESCQGALVCQDWSGPDDEEGVHEEQWFAASDVPSNADLRGLVAFFYACYGLGTPQRDSFDQTAPGKPRLLAPYPLISRLPQRLLSHSNGGALAVIGHVDRAWTASFEGSPNGEGLNAFRYALDRLLRGHTVGYAMYHLSQSYAGLATMLGTQEENMRIREEVDGDLIADLLLLRSDARNFMVFGDPAVRLPGADELRR